MNDILMYLRNNNIFLSNIAILSLLTCTKKSQNDTKTYYDFSVDGIKTQRRAINFILTPDDFDTHDYVYMNPCLYCK